MMEGDVKAIAKILRPWAGFWHMQGNKVSITRPVYFREEIDLSDPSLKQWAFRLQVTINNMPWLIRGEGLTQEEAIANGIKSLIEDMSPEFLLISSKVGYLIPPKV